MTVVLDLSGIRSTIAALSLFLVVVVAAREGGGVVFFHALHYQADINSY